MRTDNTPLTSQLDALREPVKDDLERYQALFRATLRHDDDYLGKALNYVASRSGKMMRPLLVLLMAKEWGEVSLTALRAAVTLELLHTASLVHDDVVDESEARRGKASVNQTFGNKVAVLVGDYLLSLSLRQAALTGNIEIVDIIARLGGTLSEGEVQQLENIHLEVSTEVAYFKVITNKTASLFAVCTKLGALAAKAPKDFVNTAARFGEITGLCFQLRDDIFDYFQDNKTGKPAGNDMAEGKLTLPVIHALTKTKDAEASAWAKRVKEGNATPEEIAALVKFTKENGGIDYAIATMEKLRKEALPLLDTFQNKAIKNALAGYLDYTIGRNL